MKKIKLAFQMFRLLWILPGVNWKDSKFRMDLERWKEIGSYTGSDVAILANLLWSSKEFRNVFIYRNRYRKIYRYWIALWYRPLDTLFIETTEIGGGLYIQHGFATMIAAKSIGENVWINQQVTVGHTGKGCPVIGDNVMITCGAKVLGDIKIGNNVVVGANAVVVKDVADNLVVGGVPAHELKRGEQRDQE